MPGKVQLAMLRTLAASPDGTAGFRRGEVSHAAVQNGEVRVDQYLSDAITYYRITDKGLKVLEAVDKRRRPVPMVEYRAKQKQHRKDVERVAKVLCVMAGHRVNETYDQITQGGLKVVLPMWRRYEAEARRRLREEEAPDA